MSRYREYVMGNKCARDAGIIHCYICIHIGKQRTLTIVSQFLFLLSEQQEVTWSGDRAAADVYSC